MGNAIPYRWICHACGQGNAAGVAKCVKCNTNAVVGSAPVEEAAWRAAVNDNDPARLQEDWPLHIRWTDGAAIVIVAGTLIVLDITDFSLRWLGGFLVAGVLAIIGEYAKHIEHRKRVLRYVAALEAAEDLAIRRGERPAAASDLLGVHKRPRLLGAPVLALLSGMVAWIMIIEAPTGYLTPVGIVFAGLCALLCWSLVDKKKRRGQRADAAPGRVAARGKRGTPKDNPKGSAGGKR
jgi:hypothetical protein